MVEIEDIDCDQVIDSDSLRRFEENFNALKNYYYEGFDIDFSAVFEVAGALLGDINQDSLSDANFVLANIAQFSFDLYMTEEGMNEEFKQLFEPLIKSNPRFSKGAQGVWSGIHSEDGFSEKGVDRQLNIEEISFNSNITKNFISDSSFILNLLLGVDVNSKEEGAIDSEYFKNCVRFCLGLGDEGDGNKDGSVDSRSTVYSNDFVEESSLGDVSIVSNETDYDDGFELEDEG